MTIYNCYGPFKSKCIIGHNKNESCYQSDGGVVELAIHAMDRIIVYMFPRLFCQTHKVYSYLFGLEKYYPRHGEKQQKSGPLIIHNEDKFEGLLPVITLYPHKPKQSKQEQWSFNKRIHMLLPALENMLDSIIFQGVHTNTYLNDISSRYLLYARTKYSAMGIPHTKLSKLCMKSIAKKLFCAKTLNKIIIYIVLGYIHPNNVAIDNIQHILYQDLIAGDSTHALISFFISQGILIIFNKYLYLH